MGLICVVAGLVSFGVEKIGLRLNIYVLLQCSGTFNVNAVLITFESLVCCMGDVEVRYV